MALTRLVLFGCPEVSCDRSVPSGRPDQTPRRETSEREYCLIRATPHTGRVEDGDVPKNSASSGDVLQLKPVRQRCNWQGTGRL